MLVFLQLFLYIFSFMYAIRACSCCKKKIQLIFAIYGYINFYTHIWNHCYMQLYVCACVCMCVFFGGEGSEKDRPKMEIQQDVPTPQKSVTCVWEPFRRSFSLFISLCAATYFAVSVKLFSVAKQEYDCF